MKLSGEMIAFWVFVAVIAYIGYTRYRLPAPASGGLL